MLHGAARGQDEPDDVEIALRMVLSMEGAESAAAVDLAVAVNSPAERSARDMVNVAGLHTLQPRSADPDGARDHFPDRHSRDC